MYGRNEQEFTEQERSSAGKRLSSADNGKASEQGSIRNTMQLETVGRQAVPIPLNDEKSDAEYIILIVDDSDTDRAIYRRYLSKSRLRSCTLIETDSGEAGLAACQKLRPDLILLDYILPDADGLDFLTSLNETLLSVPPVIMLTGQGDEKVAVEAMKLGVRDYLIKGDLNAEQFDQAIYRVLSQQALQQLVDRQQQQQQLMAAISLGISKASTLESILQTATDGMRQMLNCDRAAIYQFDSDLMGTIVAESVLPPWPASLGQQVEDTCFKTNGVHSYLTGHKTVIPDIYDSRLTPCHIKMLERFQVRANLVVPILINRPTVDESNHPAVASSPEQAPSEQALSEKTKIWGLLIAHHCRSPREWRANELTLLEDLAVQSAIAIRQTELIGELTARAEALSESNARLAHTADLLAARNQELDEFTFVASHDLRAPLRAISNLAEWLEDDLGDKVPEENKEQLQLMRSRVARLDSFVLGLLDYSRAGRETLSTEIVDTRSLISEVIDSLAAPST
ncbi:MAG: response regulator, partial [Cyanobacteria bacterium J06632_3]